MGQTSGKHHSPTLGARQDSGRQGAQAPRILIVADRCAAIDCLCRSLAGLGYSVVDVVPGLQGFPAALKHKPDLILADVAGEAGEERVALVAQIQSRLGIPVISLGVYPAGLPEENAAPAQPYGYLFQPYTDRQLGAIIRMALQRHGIERRLRQAAGAPNSIGDRPAAQSVDREDAGVGPDGPPRQAAAERQRSEDQLRDRDRASIVLDAILAAVADSQHGEAVLPRLLRPIRRQLGADTVSLRLTDSVTGSLVLAFTLGAENELDEDISDAAARPALPGSMPAVARHTLPGTPAETGAGLPAASFLAVPLAGPARTRGSIELTSALPNAFTAADRHLLEVVGPAVLLAAGFVHFCERHRVLAEERERVRAQLVHGEKMSALGRLAASIAHEINNPLQAVEVCLSMAAEELAEGQRREKLERYLGLVSGEIERVTAIVQRMRDFYRPARAGTQPTDLHATLEAVLALCGKHLQHGNVTVVREWADRMPLILANPDNLKQVFLNLVLNAVDSMPDGGTLSIRTGVSQKPVSGGGSVRAARIDFSDTGVGISPEQQARLFEPFFTTKDTGSGLGLFVSYGIIQSHGGEITVESPAGQGTTFSVLLPAGQL